VPLPSRDLAGTAVVSSGPTTSALRERALDVLLDPALAHVVDLVCWLEHGLVHVADSGGHVALAPDGAATVLAGRDPVADQDPYGDDGYPFAAVRLHSLFADPRAPTWPSCTPARTTGPSGAAPRRARLAQRAAVPRAAAARRSRRDRSAAPSTAWRARSTSPPRSPT
jgi:hypothetical protein